MSDGRLVFKFGGTSVADADRINHVARLVAVEPRPPLVVVSALGGTTDLLVAAGRAVADGEDPGPLLARVDERHREAAAALADDDDGRDELFAALEAVWDRLRTGLAALPAGRELDDLLRAAGEDLSAPLVAHAVRAAGRDARFVDARRVVRTDDRFGQARPDEEAMTRLAGEILVPLLDDDIVPVVQGFVGATADGRTTTLGRGGSDHTATLLGAALDAETIHIWTDVDGILSGDPRAVDGPRILDVIGFEEAVELAYFGAKVLHPGAAKHAVSRGLAVRIRNTFAPEAPGTLILTDRYGPPEIAAVAFKPGVALIKVRSHPQAMPYGFLARVFEILARHHLPVDLVATSHTSTAFTLDASEELSEAARELQAFAEVEVVSGLATVTVVGHGLLDEPGVNGRVFDAVGQTPVHLISQASDVSLSFVVAHDDATDLVGRLHDALIDSRTFESTPETR